MVDAPYRLSLLDKSPIPADGDAYSALQTSLNYAQAAENAGFNRIWYAEHHGASGLASTAPEILAAFILARTKRIRVGSGGVLLQHYSPYKVAESFRLLSALAPDRVDIGIGKAPGGMPFDTQALQSEMAPGSRRRFDEKLAELDAFLGDGLPKTHFFSGASPKPDVRSAPSRFLLGASPQSAQLAASLGWNFCYAGHHNGDPLALRRAQAAFGKAPNRSFSLAINVHVGETDASAAELVTNLSVFKVVFGDGHAVNLPSEEAAREYARQYGRDDFRLDEAKPHVVTGSARSVRAELDRLHREYAIDEFIIDNPVAAAKARLSSIELLAGAFQALEAAE